MALRLVLLSLLVSAPALAQQGVIAGAVLHAATQQPLGEARVTATSPNLQGEQVVVTDALGQFRMPQLPPGPYALRIEKEPFQPYTRTGILLRAHRTVRITAQLLPPGVTSTVGMLRTQPAINVNEGCLSLSVDFVRHLAASRTAPRAATVRPFVSLAELAPRSPREAYALSTGSASADSAFVIDGVSRLEPEWFHPYTPIVRPTGTEQRLHVYPEELP